MLPAELKIFRRHLNNGKINQKKRIHRLRLTMKHKEKRPEYARIYQTMSAKDCRTIVFSGRKKFNFGPDSFQKYWHANKNSRRELLNKTYWKRISHELLLIFRKTLTKIVSGRQKTADYVKMLNDLSLAQEGCRLCGEEWTFQEDNAAIHNASITKKYLFEQKIRLLDHPTCSPDLSHIENL